MIPQTSLDSLEFNKLLEIIAGYAHSDPSRDAIFSIVPLSSREEIEKRFACVKEIWRMSQEERPLGILPFNDILPVLKKVRPEDAILEPVELVCLMDFLHAVHEAVTQIRVGLKPASTQSSLNELTKNIAVRGELLHRLNNSIDREGNILDSASPALAELRAKRRGLENRIIKRLEEITRDESTAPFLQDTFITQRSGRWVIPVRMDSKGQVSGVVHDVSRTGETAFVEPIAIIGLSNELENIIADEKGEEIRILRELGRRIREIADEIEGEFKTLVFLDLINSIACFAQEFHMQIPEINEQNVMRLTKARHPLLLYAAARKDDATDIVPIDAHLGGDKTVMAITGPNSGGKTVAIKTIGLLSVMALSGMPVPADTLTSIPLFKNLLVDIGDRQSIADNLSTFTAHLANMMEFLNKSDSETLVLIDELGTGTDPEEGAALACTILEELKQRRALIFATTHLTDVKVFVHKADGMVNASMEFDRKTLAPLYRLRLGEPGHSFALETAKRYGLPERIIESAKGILGKRKADLENLIHDLDQKRRDYEEALEGVKRQETELKTREERIEESKRDAEIRIKDALANAYKEASEIVSGIKRKMHDILLEIKKKDKDRTQELLNEVVSAQEKIIEKAKEYEAADIERVSMDELKEGDVVFVKSMGYDATVVKLLKKKNRLLVKAGSMEMEAPLSDVGMKKGKIAKMQKRYIKPDMSESAVAAEINIIGLRVDEALTRLEKFLNDATLAGLSEVVIIHGVGMGILAKAVQGHLSGHSLVNNFRSGEQFEGGGGVTVASLK